MDPLKQCDRKKAIISSLRPQATHYILLLLVLLFGTSCTTVQKTPVYGVQDEIETLVGTWRGEYESRESGRYGRIYFELEMSADSAVGHIMMSTGQWDAEQPFDFSIRSGQSTEMLTIRFVSIGDGRVVGRLDEYQDPNCGCQLETIFEGHVEENRIEGIYASHGDIFHLSTSGRWWVERVFRTSRKQDP